MHHHSSWKVQLDSGQRLETDSWTVWMNRNKFNRQLRTLNKLEKNIWDESFPINRRMFDGESTTRKECNKEFRNVKNSSRFVSLKKETNRSATNFSSLWGCLFWFFFCFSSISKRVNQVLGKIISSIRWISIDFDDFRRGKFSNRINKFVKS